MTVEAEDIAPDWRYASYRSVRGALQRGQGSAVAWLRDHPDDAQLVYECTSRDTRWDWQVDDRRTYLARLLRDLRLDLAPLITQQRACGPYRSWPDRDPTDEYNQFDLTVGTLETLARTGNTQAREALRGYVRDGARWVDALETISYEWPAEWWDDLWETAAARLGVETPPNLWAAGEPWERWRGRDSHFDRLLDATLPTRHDYPATQNDLAVASDADLVTLLRTPHTDRGTVAAVLRQIRRRGKPVPELLDLVEHLAPLGSSTLVRALHPLGRLVAPPARTWAADPTHPLFRYAPDLLADHGDEQDIPTLLTALDGLADQWCGWDQLTAGIARILSGLPPTAHGEIRTQLVRRLRSLTDASPHSYERASYLRSLLLLDQPDTMNTLAIYLLDCEPEVRRIAAENAPLTSEARRWLTELRDDPIEDHDVKHTAARRL
ncbi:hypothetical protein [Pseudofrankia inefficax]|nr:hypothetical protein [Pseudofrankia inefficax]